MKRLLAQIGITYFSVLAVAFYVHQNAVFIIGCIALAAGILLVCIKRTRKTIFIPAMAFAAAVACAVNIGYTALSVQPVIDRYADSEHEISAVITEEPYRSYSMTYYRLKTTEIDGEPVSFNLLLKTGHALDADPDDTLHFTATTEQIGNNYYLAKGYRLVADSYILDYTVTEAENHSLYYYAIGLRNRLRAAFDTLLPEDCASLCKAVFIGDKYALDLSVRDSFRFAGASYFIVISGMHFAVLCLLLLRLTKRLNRWLRLLLVLLFIGVYMAVTGFQPSVMRSGVMMVIMVLGITLRRMTYSLNHLGIAGILLPLLMTPYAAGDTGLILSFYATMSILLWAEPIAKKLCFTDEFGNIFRLSYLSLIKNRLRRIKEKSEKKPEIKLFLRDIYNRFAIVLSVGLAANILVFPISVFMFGAFSLVTLLSSVLLYWAIYLIVALSLLVSVIFLISPLRFIAAILAYPLMLLCKYVLWIVSALGSLPFAYIKITAPAFYIWLLLTILLGVWVLIARDGYRRLPKAAVLSALILVAVMLTHSVLSLNTLRLEAYDCGDGVCVGVNSGGRLYLISMNAKSKELYGVLNRLTDRYGGAEAVLCKNESQANKFITFSSGEFAFSRYLLYDREDDDFGSEALTFSDDSSFLLDDGVTLNVAPRNKRLICLLEAGDRRILVLPGGVKSGDIPDDWCDADTVILSELFDGIDALHGFELIVSHSAGEAEQIADALGGSFNNVYLTCQGDISIDLR